MQWSYEQVWEKVNIFQFRWGLGLIVLFQGWISIGNVWLYCGMIILFLTVSESSSKIDLSFSSTNYIAVPERKVLKLSSSVVCAEVLPQKDESEMPIPLHT